MLILERGGFGALGRGEINKRVGVIMTWFLESELLDVVARR